MITRDERAIALALRRVRDALKEQELEWRDVAPHLALPPGMVSPVGQELTEKRDLRVAPADEANLRWLLQYHDVFPELAEVGQVDLTKITRLALRRGIEQLFHEVAYWERGGD